MITDEVSPMFELSNDLLFRKIPEEEYRQSIADLAAHSRIEMDVRGMEEKEAFLMYLAHEYFHNLEYHSSEIADYTWLIAEGRIRKEDFMEKAKYFLSQVCLSVPQHKMVKTS